MTKLYVKLQLPTIELTVKAKDSSGATDKLIVGFKRYEAEKSSELLLELQNLFSEQVDHIDDIDTTDIDNFMKDKVSYIRQVDLILVDEDDKQSSLSIIDTRKAKPLADRWETPEECLAALLDMYLASSPWRSAFNTAVQKALVNTDQDEGKLKN